MKTHFSYLAALAAAAALAAVVAPVPSNGQAADDVALTRLITEVTAQQKTIADNQAKLDEKLAKIGEDVRQARIFAARGGGKVK